MKKKKNILQNLTLLAIIVIAFAACEKDFATLESDVVNPGNSAHFDTDKATYPVIAFNQQLPPVQTNALTSHFLGHYNDNVFGASTANFVSQLTPSVYDTTFEDNVIIDSIVLTVPFFSTQVAENDETSYRLDSVYGKNSSGDYLPVKLSIFQNNFYLRNFDPGTEFDSSQKYYSDGTNGSIPLTGLEGEKLYEESFTPSNKRIKLTSLNSENEIDSTFLNPSLRIKLENPNDTFWQELIFEKSGSIELSNQNNFIDHFRGLYFKAESIDNTGSLMLLNFRSSNSHLIIYYKDNRDPSDEDDDGIPDYADVDKDGDGTTDNGIDTDGDGINDTYDVDQQDDGEDDNANGIDDSLERNSGEYRLNFSGNLVNVLDNTLNPIPNGDPINGDESLHLKGGVGSMAVINLFNEPTEFENFKNSYRENDVNKRIINEAYLEFYVDQNAMLGEYEPDRLFLYDVENSVPLIDYFLDQTITTTSNSAKLSHLKPLERVDDESNGQGIKYRVRITEHINNLVIRDSTNVRLGLVVMPNVNAISPIDLKNASNFVSKVPLGSFITPYGTVLHGSNSSDEDKKVKLTIYYTEPNSDN